jgi:hypothetical protein
MATVDPESKGNGEVSDKPGWKGRGQQLRDSRWGTRGLFRSLGPAKEKIVRWNPGKGYSVGLLGAKTEIPD